MSDAEAAMEARLVPGRECGSCNVCCVSLMINDPELQKLPGYRCPNTTPDHGCRVYESRPHACRTFYCGWRLLKWIREPLRPDTSGVLVRLHYDAPPSNPARRLGVAFTFLRNAALKAEGLAETVAAAVAADVPVFLHVLGPPGHTASQARINDVLIDAVENKDKPALLQILRQAVAKGRAGKHRPIVLSAAPRGDAVRPEDLPGNQ